MDEKMNYIVWLCPECKRWQIQSFYKARLKNIRLICKYERCKATRKLYIRDKYLGQIKNVAIAYIGTDQKEARWVKWKKDIRR